MKRIGIVGNLTMDYIHLDSPTPRQLERPGGPAYYAYKVLERLGDVELVPIGYAPPHHPLAEGRLKAASTECLSATRRYTVFKLEYRSGGRHAEPVELAPRIGVELVIGCIEKVRGIDALILTPVFDEIHPDLIRRVTERQALRGRVVAVDVQGFYRAGLIRSVKELRSSLPGRGLVHVGLDEAEAGLCEDLIRCARSIVAGSEVIAAVTMSERGSIVADRRGAYRVPAYGPFHGDPTGAGDVYLAAFVYSLLEGMDLRMAALVASVSAGLHVGGGLRAADKNFILREAARMAGMVVEL